jgi:hypothetical protein
MIYSVPKSSSECDVINVTCCVHQNDDDVYYIVEDDDDDDQYNSTLYALSWTVNLFSEFSSSAHYLALLYQDVKFRFWCQFP